MSIDGAGAEHIGAEPAGDAGEDAIHTEALEAGFEFSSGGVVVRDAEVAVIVPTRRAHGGQRVLGLPKGHPEPGESSWEGAAREVREEAGVVGESLGSLGYVEYRYERSGKTRRKRVEFFLIAYAEGSLDDHDHEVVEARWMPLAEAAEQLTYSGEREMVGRAITRLTNHD
jgi:8-oxo-dGTP pyrophosphatase MutT (NUDIX family)